LDWPANPFWDFAVELYRRPGVEDACLELQRRHGLDVNVVLFCCWLATRGSLADDAVFGRIAGAAAAWQVDFVRPLRAVRNRLKAALIEPHPGSIPAHWPDIVAALRQRVLALEIDGERLEQLMLAGLAAGLTRTAAPGLALASDNLRRYWRFAAPDRGPLATLLQAAFPEASAHDVAASLDWLEPRSRPRGRGQAPRAVRSRR
jgi:uncharacterized protein (TIGR02444 family)